MAGKGDDGEHIEIQRLGRRLPLFHTTDAACTGMTTATEQPMPTRVSTPSILHQLSMSVWLVVSAVLAASGRTPQAASQSARLRLLLNGLPRFSKRSSIIHLVLVRPYVRYDDSINSKIERTRITPIRHYVRPDDWYNESSRRIDACCTPSLGLTFCLKCSLCLTRPGRMPAPTIIRPVNVPNVQCLGEKSARNA